MKKISFIIFFISIAVFLFSSGNSAGNYWGHGFSMGYAMGDYEDRISMIKDLDLSQEQADKISAIDSMYRKLYYENRENFEVIDSFRIEHRRAIEKLFNTEQREKYSRTYESRWKGWGTGNGMDSRMIDR